MRVLYEKRRLTEKIMTPPPLEFATAVAARRSPVIQAAAARRRRLISVVASHLANQHKHYDHLTLRWSSYLSPGLSS